MICAALNFMQKLSIMARIAFATDGFALVICRHPDGRFLAVEESKNMGWWLPGGHVDRGQNFVQAAIRETQEEAGIDIYLKGVLAVEHSLSSPSSARMRVIFYAEPLDPMQSPKSIPDVESQGAAWMTLEELDSKRDLPPPEGLRGEELLRWGRYVENGGLIAPLTVTADGNYDGFFKVETNGPFVGPIRNKLIDINDITTLRSILIRGGVDINETGVKSWTALHRAAADDNIEMARLLLLAGADPNRVTHKGRTALHFAASRRNQAMIRLLLMAGCDPDLCDIKGKTANLT